MEFLRIKYLGRNMDLPAEAFSAEHRRRGHRIDLAGAVDEVSMRPPPDAVAHAPLEKSSTDLISCCALAQLVPPSTLLFSIFQQVGPSHAMFVRHALRGNCHPRMLLHVPGGHATAGAVIDKLEAAVEGPDDVRTTAAFPPELVTGCDPDLGEIMQDKTRFAELLYTAATNRWGSWGDLTRLLSVGDGVVKNTNAELGRVLQASGIERTDEKWTAQHFARFVTEYRSFIVAYGQGHLGLPAPDEPFWMHHASASI